MAQRDGQNGKVVVHLGNLTLSGTTPAASAWVDTQGADKVTFILIPNTVTDAGTASGFSTEIQESDTTAAAAAAAVADDELLALETSLTVTSDSADNTVAGVIGYVGNARYVRARATGTTGTDADMTVIAILEDLNYAPKASLVGTSVAAT